MWLFPVRGRPFLAAAPQTISTENFPCMSEKMAFPNDVVNALIFFLTANHAGTLFVVNLHFYFVFISSVQKHPWQNPFNISNQTPVIVKMFNYNRLRSDFNVSCLHLCLFEILLSFADNLNSGSFWTCVRCRLLRLWWPEGDGFFWQWSTDFIRKQTRLNTGCWTSSWLFKKKFFLYAFCLPALSVFALFFEEYDSICGVGWVSWRAELLSHIVSFKIRREEHFR